MQKMKSHLPDMKKGNKYFGSMTFAEPVLLNYDMKPKHNSICRRRPRPLQVLGSISATTNSATHSQDQKELDISTTHRQDQKELDIPTNKHNHTSNGEATEEESIVSLDDEWEEILDTPAARTGFRGWRKEDDEYWLDMHQREISFRAPTSYTPEDLMCTEQPLGRDGLPSKYPAAVQYDSSIQDWRPTTEEEEEILRQPYPVIDPYFIPEADEGMGYSSFRGKGFLYDQSEEEHHLPDSNNHQVLVLEEDGARDKQPLDMSEYRRKRLNMSVGAWRVVHLGTSSAIPTRKRNVSSTAFLAMSEKQDSNMEPSMFLVDCGENTISRLVQSDWCITHGFRWIKAIFITHLHGDHIYGLPKLLQMIGKYAQYRRRIAYENGEDGSDPIIRIFGPYGTRGFLRSSLYWTDPVGVRFSVSELEARSCDFQHITKVEIPESKEIIVQTCSGKFIRHGSVLDLQKHCPPPHAEEVRTENIHASEDGLWHVWQGDEDNPNLEIVAAPLQHRVPCFGYVFREKSSANKSQLHQQESIEIDMNKARALGVYGSQFGVLRSGRSVIVSKTGVEVKPQDVAIQNEEKKPQRKVTILGDTCNSQLIANAAADSNLLIHEATFTNTLWRNARRAMHSTAAMAGAFAKTIGAQKLALTHFSSRYEVMSWEDTELDLQQESDQNEEDKNNDSSNAEEDEDYTNPNQLIREAYEGYGEDTENVKIVAAYDFLEHDI